jgi:uncharacterized protein (DUF1330 family)
LTRQEDGMPAYVIANVNVQDAAAFEEYRRQVPATIAKHGGRYVVRGGHVERLEGAWNPTRLVVLEFPSMAEARRWYDSEEYRAPKALRMTCAVTDVILVEGV